MHNTSFYKTMKKILYILLITLMGLYSCATNSDEIDNGGGDGGETIVDLEPEDVYGKWETYYSTKLITENPGTGSSQIYKTFRAIDLDGFTFEMYTENGEYLVKGYNGIGVQTSQGWYEIKDKDSIIFYMDSISPSKEVIPLGERQGRRVLGEPKNGVIKWDNTYMRVAKDGKTKYKVTDVYANRDVNVNPTTNDGVNPAKVKIDYDDLCRGRWVITEVYIYYDNVLQPVASAEAQKTLRGTIYDFSVNDKGEKIMTLTDGITGKETEYPVYITDDIINYIYTDDDGEKASFGTWIKKFYNEGNTFEDTKSARYDGDLKVVAETIFRFDREI